MGTIGLATGIPNARRDLDVARELARIDQLNSLPDRQDIIEPIDSEPGLFRRFGRSVFIAMLNCGGFKAMSDLRGHLACDAALQKLAAGLRKQSRTYD